MVPNNDFVAAAVQHTAKPDGASLPLGLAPIKYRKPGCNPLVNGGQVDPACLNVKWDASVDEKL